MPTIISKMKIDAAGDHSRLAVEYEGNIAEGLPPWLPGVSAGADFWRNLVRGQGRRRGQTWDDVIEDVQQLSARLGTGPDVLGKLKEADTFFVVTGQQPGTIGGALLVIYKVVTAVALAGRLEAMVGRPCVPLYWCGSDDADFQEIRGFDGLSADLMPFASALAADAHTAGMPIGAIEARWSRQVWDSVKGFWDGFAHGDAVKRLVAEAFDRGRDHGEIAGAILTGLAGGRVAVVDGRSGAIRRHAAALIAGYVEDETDVKREITEQGRRLEDAGYHAQLTVGDDSGVFLMENGLRKNVTADLHDRLVETVRHSIDSCSPGVVLRNLVQDYVFEPAAVVLGPAEVAYRAQIGPLYERFDIRRPASIPRLTATYLPSPLASLLETEDFPGVGELLTDPPAFARSVYTKSIPAEIVEAARDLDGRIGSAIEDFLEAAGGDVPPKALGRMRARLFELRKKTAQTAGAVEDVGRAAAIERWPFLPELEGVVRPRGKAQERSLSVLIPFLSCASAGDDLVAIAEIFIDDLLDGRANHVVYSCK